MLKNRLTIYVSSPDSYSDVFKVFLKCYRKYWSDCPYEFVLSTNTLNYEGIRTLCNYKQNDTWTERTISALKEIRSEYILLMNDDFFITNYVNNKKIEDILDLMDKHNLNFCKLAKNASGVPIEKGSYLLKTHKRQPYGKNLQVGIFRKSYITNLLGDGSKSAWDLEKEWLKDTYNAKNEYFDDIVASNEIIIDTVHGVAKGMWFPSALKKLKSLQIEVDSPRKIISKSEENRINLFRFMGKRCSPRLRYIIKKFLTKTGVKFTTEN